MVGIYRLKREKQYPVPHDIHLSWRANLNQGTGTTIIPVQHHDEAMLASAKYTHPEHASFAEDGNSNVCAESKVFRHNTMIRVSMTNGALETDQVPAIRFAVMGISGAFEDFDANDELTSVTVGDVLELQKETTDRQTYPIWTGTDLTAKYGTSQTLGTAAHGLTTDQKAEEVAFDPDLYYDALNYYTISDKLKKVQTGLRWFTLTANNPSRVIKFRQSSSSKSANPYQFRGILIYCPQVSTKYQIPVTSETSSVNHLNIEFSSRFLEWNDSFNHERA